MSTPIVPEPPRVPNVHLDAQQAFQVLKSGGIIAAPTDVGYALLATTAAGIRRIFVAKGRREGHNIGIIGTYQQHREIHLLTDEKFELTRVLTEDMGMIIGIIAKFDSINLHPRLAALDKFTLSQITRNGTVSIAIPEGPFLRELGRLCDADPQRMLMFGTSANLSGQGQRFRIEDVDHSILTSVDLIVDYGLQKWHSCGCGGINLDVENMTVLRKGAGYEVFRDRISRWFPHFLERLDKNSDADSA